MALIGVIEEPTVAAKILRHLKLWARAPPRGRPWRPQRQLVLDHGSGYDAVDSPSSFE
jgi:hypothetical protein